MSTVTARLAAEVAAQRLQFDAAQRAAAARLDALREELQAEPPALLRRLRAAVPRLLGERTLTGPRGVYLWGGVGRGKTLLMDWLFESLPGGASRLAERSHFYHFMRDVHTELAGITARADPLDRVAQRLASRVRVLCLDEFSVADIGDAMLLSGLLDGLFRRGVVLVTTSNLAPQDLYRDGLQRQRFLPAIDLLSTHLDVLHLDGGIDYRLRHLAQAPTYFDCRLGDTAAALRERFNALAPGVTGPKTLRIEGRELRAERAGAGTAWFEFRELCDGPRSQNDYIELAHLYDTLFIANVPTFGPGDADGQADDNAARRFIMLIDELYDRGVKLVVSAAAAPDALYRGERLTFEFQRAASRLVEMQTPSYLAAQHRP